MTNLSRPKPLSAFAEAICVAAAIAALVAPIALTAGQAAAQAAPAGAASAQATLMVDVPLNGLADWLAVRNALAGLSDGVSARIEALSSQGAIVSFVWTGNQSVLDNALLRVGYRLDAASPVTRRQVLRSAR
jgi:hypothetical protein